MGGIETGSLFEFYRYKPSVEAATVCIVLFALVALLHTYQLVRTRTWIVIPLVVGAYSESAGYIARIISSNESPNFTTGPAITQNLLTLLAPALFAATIYMCLGRLIQALHGDALSVIRPTRLTYIFVTSDVMGLTIQGAGAGVMTSGSFEEYYAGEKVVTAGLALLVFAFGLFIVVAFVFDYRMRKNPTENANSLDWKRDLRALYIASALILLRSVFRLIEYSQGNSGWLISHEWTLFVFDSIPMFAVLVLFNIIHPSHVKALLEGGKYSVKGGLQYRDIEGNGTRMGKPTELALV